MQVSMATHRSAATIVSRKVDLAGASRRGREAGPRHHQDRPATSPSSPPRSTWPSQHPRRLRRKRRILGHRQLNPDQASCCSTARSPTSAPRLTTVAASLNTHHTRLAMRGSVAPNVPHRWDGSRCRWSHQLKSSSQSLIQCLSGVFAERYPAVQINRLSCQKIQYAAAAMGSRPSSTAGW